MKGYMIEDVKIAMRGGYGPLPGVVVVGVRYDKGEGPKWLYGLECDGNVEFHLSEKDVSKELLCDTDSDRELKRMQKVIDRTYISEFEGMALGSYGELLETFETVPETPAMRLIKYLVLLLRCPVEDDERYIGMAIGRSIEETEFELSEDLL